MNIIGEETIKKQENKNKKIITLVVIAIIMVSIIIAVILGYMTYLQQTKFKVYIDGQIRNDIPKDAFIIDDANSTIYVAPKSVAQYVGYTAHDGEYKQYGEDNTKCYVENSSETASVFLNKKMVCKAAVDSKEDYDEYQMSSNVKNTNNKLYVPLDGAQMMFNAQMQFDKNSNDLKIYTLPYLVSYYSTKVTEAGYKGVSDDYMNQKAILNGLIVVENNAEKFGAISTEDLSEKIAVRYNEMKYNEVLKEFWITNAEKKVGILSETGASKIAVNYDELKVLDKKLGLYVVKCDAKYGVINKENQPIIAISFEQIGISNMSLFENEEEKNPYLLFDNCIPVEQGGKWGLYDITGKVILPVEYDNFGCTTSTKTSKKANNLLTITKGGYEAIVVCRDKKYGLVNSIGQNLIPTALTTIYSTPNGGENEYYMIYKENELNVLEYLKKINSPIRNSDLDKTTQNQAATTTVPSEDQTVQ